MKKKKKQNIITDPVIAKLAKITHGLCCISFSFFTPVLEFWALNEQGVNIYPAVPNRIPIFKFKNFLQNKEEKKQCQLIR